MADQSNPFRSMAGQIGLAQTAQQAQDMRIKAQQQSMAEQKSMAEHMQAVGRPDPPPLWVPNFQAGVTVLTGFMTVPQPISYLYCLTETSAVELAATLARIGYTVTITHLPPMPKFRGVVLGTENPAGVPYFAFDDGTLLNAGIDCAAYWTHGWPQDIALRQCVTDIKTAQQETERASSIQFGDLQQGSFS